MAEASGASTRTVSSDSRRADRDFSLLTMDGSAQPVTDRQRRDNILYYFFIVQIVGITILQKIGISLSDDAMAPVTVPLMLGGIAFVMFFVRPVIYSRRLAIIGVFFLAALVGTAMAPTYSPASVALLVALYAPFAVSFPTSDTNFRRCMNFYSNLMIAMAIITIAQLFVEVAVSWTLWPNLDELLPQSMLVQGFNYIQPIIFRSSLMKPNAIFFLEVSFLSQYLAIALAIEVVLFQRFWRIALFAGVMFGCFAGTGLLLLALTMPVLLGRLDMKYMGMIIIGLAVVALVAMELGWMDMVARRLIEYRYSGSSANMRFVAPLDRLVQFLATPGSFYTGIGAGQIEKANSYQWWPITKATVEYGAITGVLLYVMMFQSLLDQPPYRRLAFMLLVWFSIEGALLTAVNPYTCALFSSLFVLDRGPKRNRRSEPGNVTDTKADGEKLDYNRRRRRERRRRLESGDSVSAART